MRKYFRKFPAAAALHVRRTRLIEGVPHCGTGKEAALAVVTMKNLLESGVHFGHQVKRWDPRMKKYIFAQRNGIHIIDLQKTIEASKKAYAAIREVIAKQKSVLFVGTKKQAQQAIQKEAERCGQYYVNQRWLGGMLTNFSTIKKSLLRLKKLEKMEIDGSYEKFTKKEVAELKKECSKLQKNLGGIKEMKELPGALFIVDTRKEALAVAEARRIGIPIIAVVDTNCNPEGIEFPIPGNDDAIRAITLFTQIIANAVVDEDNEVGLRIIEAGDEDDELDALADVAAIEEDKEIDVASYGIESPATEAPPLSIEPETATAESATPETHSSEIAAAEATAPETPPLSIEPEAVTPESVTPESATAEAPAAAASTDTAAVEEKIPVDGDGEKIQEAQ
jgi:small subunit ribosomal protein S2